MSRGDIAERCAGGFDYLEQVRRLTVDKLSAKLNRRDTRIVMSIDPAAHALARFQQSDPKAGRREIACSREASGAGADYQN